jgi:hypothetical protein
VGGVSRLTLADTEGFQTPRATTKSERARIFKALQAQRRVDGLKLIRALDAERSVQLKALKALKTGQSDEALQAIKGCTKSVLKAITRDGGAREAITRKASTREARTREGGAITRAIRLRAVEAAKPAVKTSNPYEVLSNRGDEGEAQIQTVHTVVQTQADMDMDETEYEVHEILEYNNEGPDEMWLVSWTGYPSDENTWETKSSFTNDANVLTVKFVAFETRRKHQGKGHNKGEH